MKRAKEQLIPEARRVGLVVQELSGEVLVYDRERNKAHCLNSTAARVWEYCDGKRSVEQIARAIEEEINAPVDEDVIWLGVEQLSKTHLLQESAKLPEHKAGLSRREVMKRIGLAAAVALPVVTSIIAPSAAQAANCLPSGSACTSSAQCCSGLCNVSTCA
ncbi:MAG TPA: PqqD family peptide modification chaperone [Blastocatellia bacterium]|nr:PqqD family peptide modification chaperone [Blastocatellia bacterium]